MVTCLELVRTSKTPVSELRLSGLEISLKLLTVPKSARWVDILAETLAKVALKWISPTAHAHHGLLVCAKLVLVHHLDHWLRVSLSPVGIRLERLFLLWLLHLHLRLARLWLATSKDIIGAESLRLLLDRHMLLHHRSSSKVK